MNTDGYPDWYPEKLKEMLEELDRWAPPTISNPSLSGEPPPSYRVASDQRTCGSCTSASYLPGKALLGKIACSRFRFEADERMTCDHWSGAD